MKRTLFVHEYLRTRGFLAGLFALSAAVVAAGTLLMALPINVLAGLGAVIAVITVSVFMPIVTFDLAIDYWRSAYGRGGYLTQSLPVKGSTIFAVRLAYGAVALLVALVVNLLLAAPVALVAAGKAAPEGVGAVEYITTTLQAADPPVSWGVAAVGALILFVSAFGYLVTFYFAVSFGNESRFARLGVAGPIVVWFAVYVLMQVAAIAGIALIPAGIDYVNGGFTLVSRNWMEVLFEQQQTTGMPFGFIPVSVVVVAALIWRTAHSWNHKVSLR
ncbi:MAG: hypothetical protein Q4G51_05540 [Dermatophilus congolensis]|nr:hypothetical protein [Dermatophilus congolensis]